MEAFYILDLSVNDNFMARYEGKARAGKGFKRPYFRDKMKTAAGILITLTLLMLTYGEAFSAEICAYISKPVSGLRSIVIEGDIMKGDYERFIRKIEQYKGKISNVYVFSPGGIFSEAIRIGRAIRILELSTVVPSQSEEGQPLCDPSKTFPKDHNCACTGPCFFVFIGGVKRSGSYIVVHRPYFDENEFGQLSDKDARNKFIALQEMAREYMHEMGVPIYLQDKILGTRRERAMKLDYKTVKKYFHGDIPYRHELLQDKCAALRDDRRIRDCFAAVDNERRLAAYEKFFGR